MKYVIAVLCCIVAVGCNETKKSDRTDVTANKPINEQAHPADGNARPAAANENNQPTDEARKTPLDQKEDAHDLQLTADIRKRIVDSKMSTEAQNIKIISAGSRVTLRGKVKSEDEKDQIDKIAKEFGGTEYVDNLLEVEPPK